MNETYNLLGIGIGPFHLSLAALMSKLPQKDHLFLDLKPHFQWHSELLFSDAKMQTSFYKDLVTPIDPTSPHSFLNYLVTQGLFYAFMNTNRKAISRIEFEHYARWVSNNLSSLRFESPVKAISFKDDTFRVETDKTNYQARNLSIATGLTARIPECAKPFLGENVFHAKSNRLQDLDLTGKRVLIIGGGQTGVELFRNGLKKKWGRPESIRLISRRQNLEPLDESPFTNEYFTPHYVNEFYKVGQESKTEIVQAQKLASDGNTPSYLEELYNDLYFMKHVEKDPLNTSILPKRTLIGMSQNISGGYTCLFWNTFLNEDESMEADVVILSTGFTTSLPPVVENIKHLLVLDEQGRFIIDKNFRLKWQGPAENKIYALNFGRHSHGISEPQTSLMAWRSATIINDLLGQEIYQTNCQPTFIQYEKHRN